MRLGRSDVFCSVAGGMRVSEPAADLPMAMAIVSAATGVPVPPDLFAFGEVGLAGEVRQVPHAQRRLSEAHRLGFRHAARSRVRHPIARRGMELIRVRLGHGAVKLVGAGPITYRATSVRVVRASDPLRLGAPVSMIACSRA